jgi:hypothetical protein
MTADNENTIREIISNAKPVQDPLKELVQKTESDPGAPFEPEMIQMIAELRKDDPAEYFRLRGLQCCTCRRAPPSSPAGKHTVKRKAQATV